MTIKVKIEHTQPGYDKAITAEVKYMDVNGNWTSHAGDHYKTVIQPGQSKELYVWGTQSVHITEGPAAEPITEAPAPQD